MLNLPKDKNQCRLKDRIPEQSKYFIYNHDLNALIEAPFSVVTVFPDYPNPVYKNYQSSESLPSALYDPTHHNSSFCSVWSQIEPIEMKSVAIQADDQTWDT